MLRKMRFLLVSLSLIILAAVIVYSNPQRLLSVISGSDLNYLFLAFVVSNIAILVRIAKWYFLLENIKFRDTVPVQLLGVTISNFSPGKIAEPAKALILKLKTKKSVSESLQSIVWERVLDIFVLLFLAFSVLQILSLSGRFLFLSIASMLGFLLLISLLVAGIKRRWIGYRLFHLAKRLPILNRIDSNFIENFYRKEIKTKRLVLSFLLTLAAWVLDGFIFYFAFKSIGVDINPLLLSGLIALATLVGIMSFLPGGIGSMEIVMLFLLGILGVEGTLALSGILIARFLSIWYVTVLGGLSFLYISKTLDIKNVLK